MSSTLYKTFFYSFLTNRPNIMINFIYAAQYHKTQICQGVLQSEQQTTS